MALKALIKAYRAARGREKVEAAWNLVRAAAMYTRESPYWRFLRERYDVDDRYVKEAMRLLEKEGLLRIHRSVDGRHLYVLTLKDIRENPVRLDRWLGLTSKKPRER